MLLPAPFAPRRTQCCPGSIEMLMFFQQVSAVADEIHVFGRQNCAGGVLHEN